MKYIKTCIIGIWDGTLGTANSKHRCKRKLIYYNGTKYETVNFREPFSAICSYIHV